MFGKQYFKVDLFIDKKSVTDLYDKICEYQNQDTNAPYQIQCVHTEKKIPCITVQVHGAVKVTDLVQMLLEYTDNFGYVVWLSKEEDFNAVKECTLSIFNIDTLNVFNEVQKSEEVKTEDEPADEEEGGAD